MINPLQGYIQKENCIKKNTEITSYHYNNNNNKDLTKMS
jgi:hypothetical protein